MSFGGGGAVVDISCGPFGGMASGRDAAASSGAVSATALAAQQRASAAAASGGALAAIGGDTAVALTGAASAEGAVRFGPAPLTASASSAKVGVVSRLGGGTAVALTGAASAEGAVRFGPAPLTASASSARPQAAAASALVSSVPPAATAPERERELRSMMLKRPSPAATPAAPTAAAEEDPYGAGSNGGADQKRRRRFDRGATGPAATSAPPMLAEGAAARARAFTETLMHNEWYSPPPYSWSMIEFGPSTDDGEKARNFADGGGWGRCEVMCPEAEVQERLHESKNTNKDFEVPIEPTDAVEPWLITMFHRNDAARTWKPTDIRCIGALAASVEHLLTVVLERPSAPTFIKRASFVRDRLRQVRQEVTMQLDSFSLDAKLCAVDLLEVCTRFHIMVEHCCCELGLRNLPTDEAKFDSKMNMDMYTQAIGNLIGLYQDLLKDFGVVCENEDEFQSYLIISAADGFERLSFLPARMLAAPRMKRVARILGTIKSGDFNGFFRELKQADYLTACLMHKHFDAVRERALNAINRAFRMGSETPLPLAKLRRMLCLEDEAEDDDEARRLVEHFGLVVTADGASVLLRAPQYGSELSKQCDSEGNALNLRVYQSHTIIEPKRAGRSMAELLMSPNTPEALRKALTSQTVPLAASVSTTATVVRPIVRPAVSVRAAPPALVPAPQAYKAASEAAAAEVGAEARLEEQLRQRYETAAALALLMTRVVEREAASVAAETSCT
ncbi:80 kda mcm3-associated protein [Chrysochromulina tobinii]|uniref:80 kDa mcm3-associated protein n=1 Tax=Chrysochromulina tobinii TaxID=1460289 RepID=A0A0M0JXD6_9EUKA|nr:80 kda mcm3-associated protein [Chrysochromulina tobinii]|eukprot:KOO30803.1 80 kda mcm3-associated protein [Chrysochromulina sp. CCMP291]